MTINKKIISAAAIALAIAGGGVASIASAQAPSSTTGAVRMHGMMRGKPGTFGTVTAINGSTITITSKSFGQNTTTTTYTINAGSATVTKNGAASSVSAIAIGDTISVQGSVSGTTVTATSIRDGMMQGGRGVFGTVASISGNSITVTSKGFGQNATTTTYTVDATNAAVTKSGAASSVSTIAVGDTVMIQGTVNGTSVTATKINDGKIGMGAGSTIPEGNGQPVVAGTISSINGNSVIITNPGNQTYTIDVTNAKITKSNVAGSISSLVVGDRVVAQGTVNGNSVTATTVIDQGIASTNQNGNPGQGGNNPGGHRILGGIGNFFSKLFGF